MCFLTGIQHEINEILFVHFLFTTTIITSALCSARIEIELHKKLFDDYNVDVLPSLNGGKVNITFDIALKQIIEMDEKTEVLVVNTWLRQYWNDPSLVWNASEWGGISNVAVAPDKIWKPDLTLYNNAEKDFQGLDRFGKTKILVDSNGSVVWLIPAILRSVCELDMTYFPFDEQVCPLTFGSWAYDQESVDLYPKNSYGDISSLSRSGEFIIKAFESVRYSMQYPCCSNPYVIVTYNLSLHRRGKFYIFNLILPGGLIALLSCFAFFLPPLTGERTGLIITNFLSLSVYVLIVSDSVPPSSDNVPLLVKFYTTLMCEIGLALMTNCMVTSLAAKTYPVPNWVSIAFNKNHFKTLFEFLKNFLLSRSDVYELKSGALKAEYFGTYSRIIDGIRENDVEERLELTPRQELQLNICNDLHPSMKRRKVSSRILDCKCTGEHRKYLKNVDDYFTILASEHKIRINWLDVVKTIDKICFVTFICMIFTSTILIFSSAPKLHI